MSHQAFRGVVPADRYYCRDYDMWVQLRDGDVVIGATGFGLFLAGEIIAFTAKPKGAEISRGRGMATVECHKTVLAVHAPVSFTLSEANETAEERPDLLNSDPFGAGWMARGRPLSWAVEMETLTDADGYRQHILSLEPEASFDD